MILRHWQRKERHTQEGEPLFLSPAGGAGGRSRRETGHRSRRKAGNRRRDFRAGKSPAGTSEGQNRPQSAVPAAQFSQLHARTGDSFPAGNRPQEPQEGREQAEGLPGGEIPGGNV